MTSSRVNGIGRNTNGSNFESLGHVQYLEYDVDIDRIFTKRMRVYGKRESVNGMQDR